MAYFHYLTFKKYFLVYFPQQGAQVSWNNDPLTSQCTKTKEDLQPFQQ